MKAFALAVALGLVLVSLGFGSPLCSTYSTYAGLVGTGSTGCQIGDKLFSDFFIGGDLNGSQVSIVQFINDPPVETGFSFQFNLSAGFGSSADFAIGYLIQTQSGQPLIDSAELEMHALLRGQGLALASIDEQVCAGDSDIQCDSGTIYSLSTSLGIPPNSLQDRVVFGQPVSEVFVSKNLNVFSNTGNVIAISLLTETVDQVGSVPEPATMGLGVLGILLGLGIKRFSRA
jgi:hypothetical protein